MSQISESTSKKQRRVVIVLGAIISPLIFYLLYSCSWLIEALRTDNYSYGILFYTVISFVSLVCNALIVSAVYRPSTREEKFRLWLKVNFIAILFALSVILLFVIIYLIVFPAHWNFG